VSRTSAKRLRFARSQARKRRRLLRRMAQIVDTEMVRRSGPGGIPGLDGLCRIGWPWDLITVTGSIGGRSRSMDHLRHFLLPSDIQKVFDTRAVWPVNPRIPHG
jgi:hypothetical protein